MHYVAVHIIFSKKLFNQPIESAVYILMLAPESDGKGAEHDPN